jgi:hypothetical protein
MMKNFEEPLRPENTEAEVIPFENRKNESDETQCLLPKRQIEDLHSRWNSIQTGFIDEPSRAVKDADALVDSATQQISEAFAAQRRQLQKQWSRGDETSTEDLRVALQRYRDFFSRLLSI